MKNSINKIFFYLQNRFILFSVFFLIFVSLHYFFFKSLLPSAETKDLWFYSGIFMVLFSILFIEPYYSSPKNVITNSIPLILVLCTIRDSFKNNLSIWWFSIFVLFFLLIISIIALSIENKNKSADWRGNRFSNKLKNISIFIGQGKVMYSLVFIYFLLANYSINDTYTLTMFIIWFFIISLNPKSIHNCFVLPTKVNNTDQIGEIFGVQSKKIFLVRLFDDRKSIKKFDLVKFKYSMLDSDGLIIKGIVFDTYLLNQEKWAKVLQLADPRNEESTLDKNIVYKISDSNEINQEIGSLKIDKLIGIVIKGSTIGKIKFEYSKKIDDIQEGDLLELRLCNRRIFYQVITGFTEEEKLENRNETGFIEGEAIQMGEWINENLSFQKYGWVPSINTPIYKADTTDITLKTFSYPSFKLGIIPGTTLPSIINLNDAINYHLALIGVTGSGKSFLAQEIIKELSVDTKIICVDLTGEWINKLKSLNPKSLIDSSGLEIVESLLAQKHDTKNQTEIINYKKKINDKLKEHVKAFVDSDKNISIFELPDLSNTSFILEFTQMFLEGVFNYAKNNIGKKFCIVLEEAHTIVPETSFLGDLGDYSSNKGLVSKMGQIALQGRKYGVGLLVIAQRTANVSKTVLTQCNTVICFQAFDETSFSFLGNYVGKDMVQTLPNLKKYHAIVAGKAIASNIPMIIDLTKYDE